MGGRSYRRSREQGEQLRRDLHYGQYLEILKGRRDIFVSRERKSRRRSLIACIVVLVILAVVVFFLWEFMSSTWGAVRVRVPYAQGSRSKRGSETGRRSE